jgi:hypothetical protein
VISRFRVRRLLIPKQGNTYIECEDAASVNLHTLRFAVVDGATEAYDSRRWAKYLSRAWTSPSSKGLSTEQYCEALKQLGARFREQHSSRGMSWFIEAKARQGSAATFLGLEVIPATSGCSEWMATAIGDCCLMHIDEAHSVSSFPIESHDAFGSCPQTISSKDENATSLVSHIKRRAGLYFDGDSLVMMTDAIAQWFLKSHLSDATFSKHFVHMLRHDMPQLHRRLANAITRRELRNDDLCLLSVEQHTVPLLPPTASI